MSSPSLEELLGVSAGDPTTTEPLKLPTDDPAATAAGPTKEQFDEMQRKLDEQQRKNDDLERRVTALPQERTPTTIPTTIPSNLSPAEAKAQLEVEYLKDPVGFLMQYGKLIAANVENRIRAEYKPLGGAMTSSGIEAFKASMKSDPMFAAAEPEFDRLLKESGSTLDPANLPKQLDALYSTAYGNTLRHRPPDGRQQDPPNYSLGARAGGSPDTGATAPGNGKRLSEEDKIYIDTMRDAGYDDKKIAEMMKARTA
jgi:hypothetical protein